MEKLVKNRKRLAVLDFRYEKIVELNSINGYVRSESERKQNQYYSLLIRIKNEKYALWSENRKLNKNYSENLEVSKKNIISILKTKYNLKKAI